MLKYFIKGKLIKLNNDEKVKKILLTKLINMNNIVKYMLV